MNYRTIPEAARILGVTPTHLYRLVRRGLVPAIRLGTAVRVDIDEAVDALRVEPRDRGGAVRRPPTDPGCLTPSTC